MHRLPHFIYTLILLCNSAMLSGETYLRYNQAGYFPETPKRIIVMADESLSGKKWQITDQNGQIILLGTLTESVCGKGDFTPMEYNYSIDFSLMKKNGAYTFTVETAPAITLTIAQDLYQDIIHENLRFIRVQRAGCTDALDRPPAHFKDSSLYIYRRNAIDEEHDWFENPAGKKVNVIGGWYDGSSYNKNTLAAAYTTYLLLRAYEENPKLFGISTGNSDLPAILDEAQWGLDYLMRVMPNDSEFIIQVGGFEEDEIGIRMPDKDNLDGKRPAYSILSQPQMASAAAALALGSAVFDKFGKTTDARKYRVMSEKIYLKAAALKDNTCAWLEKEYDLYKDDSPYDNLLLAAVELYRLTNNKVYLGRIKEYSAKAQASYWYGYAQANLMAQLRAMESQPSAKQYVLEDLNEFLNYASANGNIWNLPLEYSFSNMYSYMGIASAAFLFGKNSQKTEFENMALHILDYAFGVNNWGVSFVVSKTLMKPVKQIRSQIYILQQRLFPHGAVVVGPCDALSHDQENIWSYFDPNAMPEHRFNTAKGSFYDHSDDLMCTEVATYGVAEAIYMQSVASKIYGNPEGYIKKATPEKIGAMQEKAIGHIENDDVFVRYNYLGYSPLRKKKLIVMSERDLRGQVWTMRDEKKKEVLSGKFSSSICGTGPHAPMPFNYTIDFSPIQNQTNLTFTTKGAQPATLVIKKEPYSWIVQEPLRWMRVARCGTVDCMDHTLCHRGDTLCPVYHRHKTSNKDWRPVEPIKYVNLAGGWHDAGDHLKMTLTTAYTVYFLLKAYEFNPGIFIKKYSKTELVDILDEAHWGLEWLMKVMPDTNEFIIQVGSYQDHAVGLRLPQDDKGDGKRECLSARSQPQMGYTAAACAIGSRIFESIGRHQDAQRYRDQAEHVFRCAMSKNVEAPAWYSEEFNYYNDDTPSDNLELAAAELYTLSRDQRYLEYAKDFSDKTRSSGWRSWEQVNMPAHLALMADYGVVKNDLKIDLDSYLAYAKKTGNLWNLPINYSWGGLYTYIGVASSAMQYQLNTNQETYEALSLGILDYTLGANNWGICFVATQKAPHSIQNPNSQIYTLQAHLFPTGAISEGPGDLASHLDNRNYFGFDVTVEPTHRFNTSKGVFYDNPKDFMCMETTIGGIADGIFMLSLAAKLYRE